MNHKKAVILYNKISLNPTKDEEDVLDQVISVSESLRNLGYEVLDEGVDLNLGKTVDFLADVKPLFVFNLVESLNKKDHLIPVVPLLLETFGIPYTGNSPQSLLMTSGKVTSKSMFRHFKIPTPGWLQVGDVLNDNIHLDPPYIIKNIWEHASAGIDEDSIAYTPAALKDMIKNRIDIGGPGDYFIEEYVDGREFNISILGGNKGPEALPPAEIRFMGYGDGKPKIVGYRAKWIEDSFEYKNTLRSFDISLTDRRLMERIKKISLSCWKNFGLSGYARVDFRVDKNSNPLVLEINANPCVSPDSGFIAAAARAGLSYDDVVKRIIEDTLRDFSQL